MRLSGSTAVKKSIEILGRRFTVPFLSSGDNFKSYNTVVTEKKLQLDSRHKLPISIVTEERSETAEFETVLSKEAAEKYALLEAMQVLDNKIPDDAKIIKTGKEMREIDGVACVYIWAECEEKIGEYVRRDKLPDAVNPDKG